MLRRPVDEVASLQRAPESVILAVRVAMLLQYERPSGSRGQAAASFTLEFLEWPWRSEPMIKRGAESFTRLFLRSRELSRTAKQNAARRVFDSYLSRVPED